MVRAVLPFGVAAAAGLLVGDTVSTINGITVSSSLEARDTPTRGGAAEHPALRAAWSSFRGGGSASTLGILSA